MGPFPVRLLLGSVVAAVGLLPGRALAEADRPEVVAEASAPEVVAAVVYKLASFVEWPSSSPAGYAICLYGNGALAEAFEAYRGRPARAGKVSVRVVPRPQAMPDCHVALVAGESGRLLEQVADAYRGKAVLVAGEGDAAIDRGAMIGLAIFEGRVVFDADRAAALREGVDLSSKLLRLARRVK